MDSRTLSRRSILTGGLTLGAAHLLGGCRRGDGPDADGRTTIRYMAWGNPEQLALERTIADEFEKRNPKIRVHLFMVPGSAYSDKLQLMLASRTAPDVMRADHYYFAALARKDYFLPLDPLAQAEPPGFLDDFVPLALDEGRWEGKLYGMNVLFGAVMIYYNRKLFAAEGLPDPYQLDKQGKWDWDTFTGFATTLTKRENGRPTQFGANVVGFPMFMSVVWNFGGQIMDKGMTRLTLAEDEGAIRGLQAYADLRWKYKCAPTPADSALSPFTFESGKIGMHWGWAGESPRFRKNIKSFDWDIVPTPRGPAGNATVIKGNQLVIHRESKHPKEAWEFVKFMTGPDAELLLGAKYRRTVPTRLSVLKDPRYLETKEPPFQTDVFPESVRRGRTLPIDARYQEWSTQFNSAMEPLFNVASEDARQAAVVATSRVNTILSGEEGF